MDRRTAFMTDHQRALDSMTDLCARYGVSRKTGYKWLARFADGGRRPGHLEVRRVSNAGTFRLHAGQFLLSQALNGQYIGIEEVVDGLWNILYYETLLGRFDENTRTITGAPSLRKKCYPCSRTTLLPRYPVAHARASLRRGGYL